MNDLRTAAQQALEALEASGCLAFKNIMCRCSELCGSYTAAQHLRAALAQQAEPQTIDESMRLPRAMAQAYENGYKAGVAHEREAIARLIEDAPVLVPLAQNDQGGCMMCGFNPKSAASYIRARSKG